MVRAEARREDAKRMVHAEERREESRQIVRAVDGRKDDSRNMHSETRQDGERRTVRVDQTRGTSRTQNRMQQRREVHSDERQFNRADVRREDARLHGVEKVTDASRLDTRVHRKDFQEERLALFPQNRFILNVSYCLQSHLWLTLLSFTKSTTGAPD